jgi:hypothetical protein
MRTAGSLKVILNTSIVAGMKFELSKERCLQFTNIDGIYLIKVSLFLTSKQAFAFKLFRFYLHVSKKGEGQRC